MIEASYLVDVVHFKSEVVMVHFQSMTVPVVDVHIRLIIVIDWGTFCCGTTDSDSDLIQFSRLIQQSVKWSNTSQ